MSENTGYQPSGAAPTLPLIVLDGAVLLPYMVVQLPLHDGIAPAVEASMNDGQRVLLGMRRADADDNDPLSLQLHRTGVVAKIEQNGKLPGGERAIVVRGLLRAELGEHVQTLPYPRFEYTEHRDDWVASPELDELIIEMRAAIDAVLEAREAGSEIRSFVRNIQHPGQLADNTGYSPDYTSEQRQELLETFDVAARLRKVRDFYRSSLILLDVQARIRQDVQDGARQAAARVLSAPAAAGDPEGAGRRRRRGRRAAGPAQEA